MHCTDMNGLLEDFSRLDLKEKLAIKNIVKRLAREKKLKSEPRLFLIKPLETFGNHLHASDRVPPTLQRIE